MLLVKHLPLLVPDRQILQSDLWQILSGQGLALLRLLLTVLPYISCIRTFCPLLFSNLFLMSLANFWSTVQGACTVHWYPFCLYQYVLDYCLLFVWLCLYIFVPALCLLNIVLYILIICDFRSECVVIATLVHE